MWQVDFEYEDLERDDSIVMEVSKTCQENDYHIVARLNGYHGTGMDWVKVDILDFATDAVTCIRLRVENDVDDPNDEHFRFTTIWVEVCSEQNCNSKCPVSFTANLTH